MSSHVEKIKERLSIIDVIASYIKLEQAGKNFRARCPFHNEKTPSFFVSPERQGYYCFGCGAKGDMFNFVEEFEGIDFRGALKVLADRAGITLTPPDPKEQNEKDRLYAIMEHAVVFYQNALEKNKDAVKYLKDRGLKSGTKRDFRVGYAVGEWREIHDYLLGKGFKKEELVKAGLIKKSEKGEGSYYDRFRSRIMFPILDTSGRVIAFSGRLFNSGKSVENDKATAKYINSPETLIFNKSEVLFGLDKAKGAIRKNDFSILVEGQMDLLMSHQSGYRNTVALSGTALTDTTITEKGRKINNFGQVKNLSNNIVIAFDMDDAGMKAAGRSAEIALSLGMDAKIATLPKGKDPADCIHKDSEIWKNAIRNSKHVIDFYLEMIIDIEKDTRKQARRIKEEVLPYIAALESEIEKSHFVREVSRISNISEEAIWEDLRNTGGKYELQLKDSSEDTSRESLRKDSLKRRLFGILFWLESKKDPVIDPGSIRGKIKDILGMDMLKEIEEGVADLKEELIFEAEVIYGDSVDFNKELDEILVNYEEGILQEELELSMEKLRELEAQNDSGSEDLLGRCQEISTRINEIKEIRISKE